MADTETAEREQMQENESGNGSSGGHDTRKTAVRAAAIAAASGATALAAKKAFSGRGSGSEDPENGGRKSSRKGDGPSVLSSALSSSWDSARGSVVPMLEDAATQAGEYVAKNAPDIVSETLVPKFINGFERGRKSSSADDGDED